MSRAKKVKKMCEEAQFYDYRSLVLNHGCTLELESPGEL